MTWTSKCAAVVFAFFIGIVGSPEKNLRATQICEQELDALNAAHAALDDAETDLLTANGDLSAAYTAYSNCEQNTPGDCQAEIDALVAADNVATTAQQAVNVASADVISADMAYNSCMGGGYPY